MSIDDIKTALLSIEHEKKYLNNLSEQIQRYRERLESPALSLDGEYRVRVQSDRKDHLAEGIAAINELECIYNELMPKVLRRETRIYKAISFLPMEEQNILIEKYIHDIPWHEVADNNNYSQSQVIRRCNAALKKLIGRPAFIDIFKDDNK